MKIDKDAIRFRHALDLMNELSAVKCDESEMADIIDGPYHEPSDAEIESGGFDDEYHECLEFFEAFLDRRGISLGEVGGVCESGPSRCFPFYFGGKSHLLDDFVRVCSQAIKELGDSGKEYCVSIALDWEVDGSRVYFYVGITRGDIRYCCWE